MLQNDEAVRIAVGRNFEEIVLDEAKDTLVEVKVYNHVMRRAHRTIFNDLLSL